MDRDRPHLPGTRRVALLLVGAGLVAAACGGGPAAQSSGSGTRAAGHGSPSSTAGKAPTQPATQSPAPSGGSTATLDACAVAGAADIQHAIGQAPSNQPKPEDIIGQQSSCSWSLANNVDLDVSVLVVPVEFRGDPVNQGVLLPALPGYQWQSVAGLGRAARVGENGTAAGGLTASREVDVVLKDHRLIVAAVGPSLTALPSGDALVALARVMSGRVS